MKYIYVKKLTNILKYRELKDKPLLSMHILNVEVPDDYELIADEYTRFFPNVELAEEDLVRNNFILPVSEGYFTTDETLQLTERKITANDEITIMRDERIKAGFLFLDQMISADATSLTNLSSYLTTPVEDFPIRWRTIDNYFINIVDVAHLNEFISTMNSFRQNTFNDSFEAKDMVQSSFDLLTLETAFNNYKNI